MKTKTQKRKEALKRREADLAYWQSPGRDKRIPVWRVKRDADKPEKKIARAEADIAALRKKLGQ